MKTCVGCGAQLDPTWKYCIHCGIAVDAKEFVPVAAEAPAGSAAAAPAPIHAEAGVAAAPLATASHPSEHRDDSGDPKSGRAGNIALLVGGITAFLIAVALTAIAIAYAVGALK